MDGGMDGWMLEGWMNAGWMLNGGWMDRRMDGGVDAGWMGRRTDGRTGGGKRLFYRLVLKPVTATRLMLIWLSDAKPSLSLVCRAFMLARGRVGANASLVRSAGLISVHLPASRLGNSRPSRHPQPR